MFFISTFSFSHLDKGQKGGKDSNLIYYVNKIKK